MIRVLIAALFAGAALIATQAHALAVTEFCPASALAGPLQGHASANLVGVRLIAATSRTVQGSIAFDTDQGWYLAIFPETALEHAHVVGAGNFESDVFAVVFPRAVKIGRYFVDQAVSTGDGLGWEAKGTITCPPMPREYYADSKPFQPIGFPNTVQANPIAALYRATGCTSPFRYASAVKLARPDYPLTAPDPMLYHDRLVTVAVALDARGQPVDAWMFSGAISKNLVGATLSSAMQSTYTPAIAYCIPVPGIYSFSAQY